MGSSIIESKTLCLSALVASNSSGSVIDGGTFWLKILKLKKKKIGSNLNLVEMF